MRVKVCIGKRKKENDKAKGEKGGLMPLMGILSVTILIFHIISVKEKII